MADTPTSTGGIAKLAVPFDFLNAMLRGRRRLIYEGERLAALKTARDVQELAQTLYPREVIGGRLGLERRLREDCIRELAATAHYLPPVAFDFYVPLLRRFQVDAIQVLLRLVAGGCEEAAMEQYVPDLPAPLALPTAELIHSTGLEQLCERLPREFRSAARRVLGLTQRAGSAAFIEMAVERVYWLRATQALAGLPPRWRTECSGPVLSELRTVRLLAVLRAARNYRIEWAELAPVLPACHGRLKSEDARGISAVQLRTLYEDPSPAHVAEAARPPGGAAAAADLTELEEAGWADTRRLANRLYYGKMQGPAVLTSYFYLRRAELKDLAKLVESVHYASRARKGHGPDSGIS